MAGSDSEPSVHAGYMKNVAEAVRGALPEGPAIAARQPELFARIDDAGPTRWLPVRTNVAMVEAVRTAIGPERTHAFLSSYVFGQLDSPMLRNLVEGGIRILGLRPAALARWVPNVYGTMFRHCGSWTVGPTTETSVGISVRDLPPELAGHTVWLESVASGMQVIFLLCRTRGEVALTSCDRQTANARFELRWPYQMRPAADDAASPTVRGS